MTMSRVNVFFRDSTLKVCYSDRKLSMRNVMLKKVLELFWNSPLIQKVVLIRKSERGIVLSKICVLDKARDLKSVISFTELENE